MRTMSELDVYKRLPLTIVSGEGVFVQDDTGRSFLDLYGGHAAALLGHSHPALVDALTHQARQLFFQTNAVDVPVRAEAAEALGALFPDRLAHVFFVNSGAEANENALRLAMGQRPGRDTIVCFDGSFHGRTSAAAFSLPNSAPNTAPILSSNTFWSSTLMSRSRKTRIISFTHRRIKSLDSVTVSGVVRHNPSNTRPKSRKLNR